MAIDMRQSTEAVELDLVKKLFVVKRLRQSEQAHGAKRRLDAQHVSHLKDTCLVCCAVHPLRTEPIDTSSSRRHSCASPRTCVSDGRRLQGGASCGGLSSSSPQRSSS